MPYVPVKLELDAKTYAEYLAGKVDLYGLAKDPKLKRVKKHLTAVVENDRENAVSKAVAAAKAHPKVLVGGGIVIAVLGAIIGVFTFFTQRKRKKAEKAFKERLDVYLEAAQDGTLTVDIIDSLIATLDAVVKRSNGKSVPIKISATQLSVLLNSIFKYTQQLASANNLSFSDLKAPKKQKNIIDLQQYLEIQKKIMRSLLDSSCRFAVGIGCGCYRFYLAFVQIFTPRHRSFIPKG